MKINNKTYAAIGGKFYEYFYGRKFLLLYFYNSLYEDCFNSDSEALSSSKDNKYSIIGELSDFFKVDGKFEFVLWYPAFKNHWRQSTNPVNEKETVCDHCKNASNYEPLHIGCNEKYWGGLVYSSTVHSKGYQASFLDGSTYHGYWHYAIAPFYLYDDGSYPAYDRTKESALWVRVILPRMTCKKNAYSTPSFNIVTFILFIS